MDFAALVAGLCTFGCVIFAALILLRGSSASLNRYFVLLVSSVAIWSIFNALSNISKEIWLSEFYSRMTFASSVPVVLLSYISIVQLGSRGVRRKKILARLAFAFSVCILPITLSNYLYIAEEVNIFYFGILSPIYFGYVVAFFIAIILELIYTLKKGNEIQKNQTRTIAAGLLITMSIISVTNIILPLFTGNENLTVYSPIFSLIFIWSLALAIIKYKLFDFRAVLARSAAYIASLGIVIGMYVFVTAMFGRYYISFISFSTTELVASIFAAIFLVIFFPYVKRFFDKITNQIFFRDSYDSEIFLANLNNILVANSDFDSLTQETVSSIKLNIKPDLCFFYLHPTTYYPLRYIGDEISKFSKVESVHLQDVLVSLRDRVVVTDKLTDGKKQKEVYKILQSKNIGAVIRLNGSTDHNATGIGYVFLGYKKNGAEYTKQDIRVLNIIASELVIAIQNALRFEQIEQFNVTLQKKIDDATKTVQRTNEKLLALDEAKDEFVSMASHQLRTPLTSIKGYLSMVLEGDAGEINKAQKEMLGQAFFSSQRMVYLISDLLNVSRLKTGKFVIEARPVYLPDVVETELAQLSEGAKAKNISVTFKKPDTFPEINLDEMKIRQVIMNFTDNAIYYTKPGGSITVELRDTGKTVEMTVKDSGIGVPRSEQHKLFTKFYRAENARKERPDGTGLGLYMAKKVIIAQSGSIIFKTKENVGSTFGFSFPKSKVVVKK